MLKRRTSRLKIIETVCDSPQSRRRTDLGLRITHETIRNVLEKHTNILQEWLRKKALLSPQNVEKRSQFATELFSLPMEYWDNIIFSAETKVMLYYHGGSQRVWHKPLTALENKNLSPTAKFEKFSEMVCDCVCSKGVGVIRILDEIMAKK